jgi:RNA polymerase sigma factor (sigma-70 family)
VRDDDPRSDAELLAACGEEPEAFGVFYDRHARVLLGFFYRRTLCAEMAADLAAETFAAAFLQRRRYRDTGAPTRAWLLGIGRRELSRALRKQRVETRARERLGVPRIEVDDASLERIEELVDIEPMAAALRQALDAMSPKLAGAVMLRVAHDLPYDEVAARLGCSEGAARVRVARGLAQLEQLLEVRG